MNHLPDEILVDILDYLDAHDVVSAQRVSSRLLKLARDNSLWRYKCFEKAPSASAVSADVASLTGALGGLSLSSEPSASHGHPDRPSPPAEQVYGASKRARAVAVWDQTAEGEKIDWYSEYIARHAPISTEWLGDGPNTSSEVRGVAVHDNSSKAVGCLEDGSICIWDIRERLDGRRKIHELGRSRIGALFEDSRASGQASAPKKSLAFSGVAECVNVDSNRQKAYIAVRDVLNEVDLQTLEVVSQSSYAWPITALSQQCNFDVPLTVGTSWSLHLYDPRVSLRDRSRSPEDMLRKTPADPEDSIAFLPNYMKGQMRNPSLRLPTGPAPTVQQLLQSTAPQQVRPSRTSLRGDISPFAHIEPGPLSILHFEEDEILIAGRFPSILSYDRRYFPRLQDVIHSGARLSGLATIPYAPKAASDSPITRSTLVACGEYNGRGSLELYSLPHTRPSRKQPSGDFGLEDDPNSLGATDREHAFSATAANTTTEPEYSPYSYKNRQEASSSKLLSVATQGSRIVFSDAEGGLKWVERDGRGLARRWNINAWTGNERGAAVSGEQVVRKIVPLDTLDSERGARGDGDLLVWTGEKIGIVTTKQSWSGHDDLVKAFEEKMDLNDDDDNDEGAAGRRKEQEEKDKEAEYVNQMRAALERQADERRWMSRFRLKYRS